MRAPQRRYPSRRRTNQTDRSLKPVGGCDLIVDMTQTRVDSAVLRIACDLTSEERWIRRLPDGSGIPIVEELVKVRDVAQRRLSAPRVVLVF